MDPVYPNSRRATEALFAKGYWSIWKNKKVKWQMALLVPGKESVNRRRDPVTLQVQKANLERTLALWSLHPSGSTPV